MVCSICEVNDIEFFFGKYCKECRRLKHIINLFSLDKVMSVLSCVLIVNEETQLQQIKEELKTELNTREYNLRKKKNKDKDDTK
tara:strand:- start:3748 stop:3999 length:252 start_codon:yes stop_codon:yes gene_type:complete